MSAVAEKTVPDARLFDVEREHTLADRLRQIDYGLNHGQAVPCLVCGGVMTGGDLGTPAECSSCGSTLE
jgi:hypothetical protein